MRKTFLPALVLLFLFSVLFWPASVFGVECGGANQPPCSPIGGINSQTMQIGAGAADNSGVVINDTNDLTNVLVRIINWFSWFVALVSVVMGLYSGMLFITARGNTAQLETARQVLIYTVVGIVVAILAFSVVTITKTFVGITP